MKRLGIYFFYDKDGVVDDYVPYYLKHLKPLCQELCVVANKPLTEQGASVLHAVCDKLIVRDNIGFDSGAYKEALETYGYDALHAYDELILCNFTCYGPVYPFQEMFDKMALSEADFWGHCRYPFVPNKRLCAKQKTNYIPEHIMSYFMVIRHNMLVSPAFKAYWQTLETATSYAEAIVVNELRFTAYFEKYGFKSDTFITQNLSSTLKENADVFLPLECLQEHSPLVKRRAFLSDYALYLHNGRGTEPRHALEYIKNHTNYDENLIWDNLLRTQPGSVLKRNLHLNYFLSEIDTQAKPCTRQPSRVAMLCYIYYADMVEYCQKYAANLPPDADIYVVIVDEELKREVQHKFSALPNKLEIRLKPNRGQLASTVLIAGRDIFARYDYICVTQAKKTSQLPDSTAGKCFCDHCWENVLKSPEYVLNVLKTFDDNPRMGYACAMPPHWGVFSQLIGKENTLNRENMLHILRDIYHISVPWDNEPVASYGECYWVRGKAYKTLLSHTWHYDDFPAEPAPKDGSVLNALERLNPMFVQYDGYYAAWIAPLSLTSVYLDNFYFYFRTFMLTDAAPLLLPEYSETTVKDAKQLFRLKLRLCKYKIANILTGKRTEKFTARCFELKQRISAAKNYLEIIRWRKQ